MTDEERMWRMMGDIVSNMYELNMLPRKTTQIEQIEEEEQISA